MPLTFCRFLFCLKDDLDKLDGLFLLRTLDNEGGVQVRIVDRVLQESNTAVASYRDSCDLTCSPGKMQVPLPNSYVYVQL